MCPAPVIILILHIYDQVWFVTKYCYSSGVDEIEFRLASFYESGVCPLWILSDSKACLLINSVIIFTRFLESAHVWQNHSWSLFGILLGSCVSPNRSSECIVVGIESDALALPLTRRPIYSNVRITRVNNLSFRFNLTAWVVVSPHPASLKIFNVVL